MLILIDADPIVYRCGFAAEQTSWHIIYEDVVTGSVDEIEFSPNEDCTAGEQMRAWLAFNEGRVTVLDKSRVVKPDPVSYALRATKVQVESIVSECEAKFGPCKMLMWISAGKCYRDKIASIRPYKGNRDPLHKPIHYQSIRDYLRTQYSAFVATGIEADDAVSIYARNLTQTGGDSYVIATIDKDLDQIPGNHYNYMNKVHYAITELEAERWFVYQILAGDITDNVVGVWKCGERNAVKLLNTIPESAYGGAPQHSTAAPQHSAVGTADRAELHGASAVGRSPSETVHRQHRQPSACVGPDSDSSAAGDASAYGEQRQLRVSGDSPGLAATESRGHDSTAGISADIRSVRRAGDTTCSAAVDGSGGTSEFHTIAEPAGTAGAVLRRPAGPAWWPIIVNAYADSQRKLACPYAESSPEAVAIEMAQLVKLQEYPGQLWHPYGDLVVPGFGEENFDD